MSDFKILLFILLIYYLDNSCFLQANAQSPCGMGSCPTGTDSSGPTYIPSNPAFPISRYPHGPGRDPTACEMSSRCCGMAEQCYGCGESQGPTCFTKWQRVCFEGNDNFNCLTKTKRYCKTIRMPFCRPEPEPIIRSYKTEHCVRETKEECWNYEREECKARPLPPVNENITWFDEVVIEQGKEDIPWSYTVNDYKCANITESKIVTTHRKRSRNVPKRKKICKKVWIPGYKGPSTFKCFNQKVWKSVCYDWPQWPQCSRSGCGTTGGGCGSDEFSCSRDNYNTGTVCPVGGGPVPYGLSTSFRHKRQVSQYQPQHHGWGQGLGSLNGISQNTGGQPMLSPVVIMTSGGPQLGPQPAIGYPNVYPADQLPSPDNLSGYPDMYPDKQLCKQIHQPTCSSTAGGSCQSSQQCCKIPAKKQKCFKVPYCTKVKRVIPGPWIPGRWKQVCEYVTINKIQWYTEPHDETITHTRVDCLPQTRQIFHNLTIPLYRVATKPRDTTISFKPTECDTSTKPTRHCITVPTYNCKEEDVTKRYTLTKLKCGQERSKQVCFNIPYQQCRGWPGAQFCKMVPTQICKPATTQPCADDSVCSGCNQFMQGPGFGSCATNTCGTFISSTSNIGLNHPEQTSCSGGGGGGCSGGSVLHGDGPSAGSWAMGQV